MASTFADVGIDISPGSRGEQRSVCPQCSHTRKKSRERCLSINVSRGLWHCFHCGYSGQLNGYAPNKEPATTQVGTNARLIECIWSETEPLPFLGPPTLYLRNRGYFERFEGHYPEKLRYHRALEYRDGNTVTTHPAIVAPFDDNEGYTTGLLRIYLNAFGKKARVENPKRVLAAFPGSLVGSAIQLFEPANDELAIAEGLETALAAKHLSGLPTWAAGSASLLEKIEVPKSVRIVHVCADNDSRGLNAARRLAKRMLAQDRDVRLAVPDEPGADWSDVSAKEVLNAQRII